MTCGVTCGVRFWILRENRIEMCSGGLKGGERRQEERGEEREERAERRRGRRQEEREDKRSVHSQRMSKAYRFS